MDYVDKIHLTQDQNRRFAKMNLTRLVFTNSRFEGVMTTLPQTQTIIDGLGVDGVSIDDINVIVQLKRGWEFVTNSDEPIDLTTAKKINQIVARDQSLAPGELRTGQGLVMTTKGDFMPPSVDEAKEIAYLKALEADTNRSVTERSIELMYHLMRNQVFWDGNKRTATLLANKMMIDHGKGLINIPVDKWSTWNQLIADYYHSGNMNKLKQWTYNNGVQGISQQPERKKAHNRIVAPKRNLKR